MHIKHWSSVSLLQWKITANLNYLPSLKSMSVYMLVPPLFADTSFPRKSLLLKSSELYNFSFHDRLEGNSHPLMASWAEISKQADVDCNNLKGEIRVGYLFPLMRKWIKLFVISGEFLRALWDAEGQKAPSLDSFSRLLLFWKYSWPSMLAILAGKFIPVSQSLEDWQGYHTRWHLALALMKSIWALDS